MIINYFFSNQFIFLNSYYQSEPFLVKTKYPTFLDSKFLKFI